MYLLFLALIYISLTILNHRTVPDMILFLHENKRNSLKIFYNGNPISELLIDIRLNNIMTFLKAMKRHLLQYNPHH